MEQGIIAHEQFSLPALKVGCFAQIWLSLKWEEIKFIEMLTQLLCMVSLIVAASCQYSHMLFWPSLEEACVWLSWDSVWSCSSLGRYCLPAGPVSSKVRGSVRRPCPLLTPGGPKGNVFVLKACHSLGIPVPSPTKKKRGDYSLDLRLYRKQSVLFIWHFDELQ